MNEFKREGRYLVLKNTDITEALTDTEKEILDSLREKVNVHRFNKDKLCLDCVVVESDWPEFEPTWKAIESRITNT